MFGKKRRKPLFGGAVEPRCEYCRKNGGKSGETLCTLGLAMRNGRCKKYEYDPLMRDPRPAPPLRAGYSEEDFKL